MHAQSCSTLCNTMDCSPSGSSVHEISQTRILEWVTISSSRGSSQLRDWTWVSYTAGRFFTIWATREAFSGMVLLLSWTFNWHQCLMTMVLTVTFKCFIELTCDMQIVIGVSPLPEFLMKVLCSAQAFPRMLLIFRWLFNLYAEYIMRNARPDETQAGIKIAGRNINNLRYADDITFWQKVKKN